MGLGLRTVSPDDWNTVRHNFQKLNSSLGFSPASSPTFTGLTLSGLTANSLIYPNSSKVLTSLGAATNGQLPIGSTGTTPVLATITGTTNQVTVTNGAGSITLLTPQDIHTGASPTFADLTLSAPSNIYSLSHDSFADVHQDVNTDATPTFDGLISTGTIDASAGKVLVEDNDTTEPTAEQDGYIGVAKVDGNARIYFAVDGQVYYTSGTFDVGIATGNPIGLLLALTYT